MKRRSGLLIAVLLMLTLALPTTAQEDVYYPTTEWRTSTPEEQGMDSSDLASLIDRLPTYEAIDSLVVIRNGYVVAEIYWHPFTREMDHQWFSVSKSVTSALIGIAIDMGYIENLDQEVLSFFPEYTVENLDENKEAMTIRDLLTMRSGFACDATIGTDQGTALVTSEDAIQTGLDLRMADAPGRTWRYCNANTYLLMAILERAIGMPAMDFAMERLFAPLGISQVEWAASHQGIPLGYMGLYVRPVDMARFGYLYLNNGRWAGEQIVSSEWVEESTTQLQRGTWDGTAQYGYQWWAYSYPGMFYTGIGAQGQFVTVYPEENLIVVVASSTRDLIGEWSSMLKIASLLPQIVTSIKSDVPLPANPDATAALEAAIANAASPAGGEVAALPEIATTISDVTYQLRNPWTVVGDDSTVRAFWRMSNWVVDSMTFDFKLRTPKVTLHLRDGTVVNVQIGMDGVYRTIDTEDGVVAARGNWDQARGLDRFNLDMRFLMNTFRFEMTCQFPEDSLNCTLESPWEVPPGIAGTATVSP